MRHLWLERIYPLILGFLASALWFLVGLNFPTGKADTILSSTLTMAAIFTGFLATSKSLLVSINDSEVVASLSKNGYLDVLIDYQMYAVNVSLLTCIWAIVGFFFESTEHFWYQEVWIFLCVTLITAFYRVVSIMTKVIRRTARG